MRRHPHRHRLAAVALASCLAIGVAACSSSSSDSSSSPGTAAVGGSGTDATGTDASGPNGAFPTATTKQLQEAVDKQLATSQVPGAVIVAWKGDKTWTYLPGKADLASGRTMVADENFPIRSITKSFTVTMILQLVDEGKIGLDDPVTKYLPDFRPDQPITIRQLANMTSGVPDYLTPEFGQQLQADPTVFMTPQQLVDYSNTQPMEFAPGTEYSYSNVNTVLLGMIVEKVTGQTYEAALKERILDPLEMTHSTYPNSVTIPDPHPVAYQLGDDDKNEAVPDVNLSLLAGAGGMTSTAADLRLWAKALVDGKFLKKETQAERFKGQKPTNGPEYEMYGLGMGEVQGWWGHTGNGLGITAAVLKDPKSDSGVIILLNSSTDSDGPAHVAQKLIPIIEKS